MGTAARIRRETKLRQAALVRGHLERLEMLSKGTHTLWQMRWTERRTEEGRMKLAALRNIRTLFRGFGTPRELARFARRFWGNPKLKDRSVVVAALRSIMLQRTEDLRTKLAKDTAEVLRETAAQAQSSTRLVLLQQKSRADLRIVPRHEPLAKQIEFLAPRIHEDMTNELIDGVGESLGRSFEGYIGDLASTIVDAAHPDRPLTMAQLSAELENDFLGISAKRANLIARTESARVYGEVSLNEMRKLGIKERRWLTAAGSPSANISPVCNFCISLANKGWTSVNESIQASLSVGVRNPHEMDIESLHPPFHPNCRCDIQANVDNWVPSEEDAYGDISPTILDERKLGDAGAKGRNAAKTSIGRVEGLKPNARFHDSRVIHKRVAAEAQSEYAAFRTFETFEKGWAPRVWVDADKGGSVMRWVDNTGHGGKASFFTSDSHLLKNLTIAEARDAGRMSIIDVVMGNYDRHLGNFVRFEGRLIPIDSGLAWGKPKAQGFNRLGWIDDSMSLSKQHRTAFRKSARDSIRFARKNADELAEIWIREGAGRLATGTPTKEKWLDWLEEALTELESVLL